MKQVILILLITYGLIESLVAQQVELPGKISITDKFYSPWGTSLFYSYELELNEDKYTIERTALEENRKKKNRKKQIGSIDKALIEKILLEILEKPTKEIKSNDFQRSFPMDSINTFFKNHAANYWINNDYQKQFITEQLTEPDNLKNNLELYFKSYDHSGYIDGSSTEVNIKFHFSDSVLSIKSKSILWCGLPIEINEQVSYSPNLAALIGELIPESKTERKRQFIGDQLFAAVIRETINNHRRKINNLESKTYQVYIDSLNEEFNILYTSIEGSFSINWNGERRLCCQLSDSSMMKNLTISYSNPIKNGGLEFPVSSVIINSKKLANQLLQINSLMEYLISNPDRKISIIYDGNASFSEKAAKIVLESCESLTSTIDLSKAVFFELRDEYGRLSRWLVTESGYYFFWWGNFNTQSIDDKQNYLKCEFDKGF